ncbi:MAG: hypothetical protein NC413_04585 [Muribaculum sp.]|nr:hypothetical protein [Muribaculum sp.]
MTKMDAFVSAMKVAFLLSKEIEGISTITWNLEYRGTTESTKEIAERMNLAMEEAGLRVGKEES